MKPITPRQYGDGKWLVDLRAHGQGRHFFPTEGKAKEFAASKQSLADKFGSSAINNLSQEKLASYVAAEMRLKAARMTLDEALSRAFESTPIVAEMDLKGACDACIESKKRSGKRETYIRVLTIHLNSFRKKFKDGTSLHTIKAVDIEEWLNEKHPNGKLWKQATKKSVLLDIQTLFAFAIKRGWCKTNPCESVEEIKLDAKPPEIFTVDECKRFMAAVKKIAPHLISYFALQLYGGLRASEAAQITPASFKDGSVEVTGLAAKTRQRRLVTINPTLAKWLKIKKAQQQYREATDSEWSAIKSEAKLVWKKNGLRHSFVSYSLPKFGIQRTAMEAGHSEQMLFKHYRALVTPREAWVFWG